MLGVVFGGVAYGCAQAVGTPGQQAGGQQAWGQQAWGHQAWSTEGGLPQSSVHRILQTRDGYIWVATEGGVARFDGVAFQVYQHESETAFASDDACCLAEDRSGALWIGTADGLVRFRSGTFRRFGRAEGLPSSSVISVVVTGDGDLLVLTSEGLVEGHDDRFRALTLTLPPAAITGLERAAGGGAWLLAEDQIFLLKGGIVRAWSQGAKATSSAVLGADDGGDGAVWTYSSSTVTVDAGGVARQWRVGRELPGVRVRSLSVDRAGIAWVGTNSGLVTLTRGGGTATAVPALQGNTVLQTFEDAEGNHWVGTEASGLHVLRSLKFRAQAGLVDKAITGVVEASDGSIWAGTRDDGLRRMRGGLVEEPVRAAQLTSPVILSLAPGVGGSVWAGTPDGLNRIESNGTVTKITSAEGLPDDYVRSLLAEKDGSVWVGTRRGLAHLAPGWRPGEGMKTLTRADGLGGDMVGSLLRGGSASEQAGDAGAGYSRCLWIGTSGGLSCLHTDGKVSTFAAGSGLDGQIVTAMVQDDSGALWVATREAGLRRMWRGRLQMITGVANDAEIDGLVTDRRGFLWLRTARGIERASIADLKQCAESGGASCSGAVASFGVADGMPSAEEVAGGSPVACRTGDGELWFATRRGLAIADAEHLPLNAVPPPVVVQHFLVDGTELDIDAENGERTELQIPFGHARFSMEYAGLSYTVPAKLRYRYILEGFDREWTNAGNRRSATYTNLASGKYRFRVQAMNDDGIWNEAGAELRFRIVPPFYRRWWFAVLMVLCAVALVAGLYRMRVRRLRRQFEAVLGERNRMAREIHDTLAQDFVGVSIQLDVVAQLLGQAKAGGGKLDAALEQVQRTRKLAVDGLADARQSIWELRANTAQDSLPTRLAKVVERYSSEAVRMHLRIGGAYRPLDERTESETLRVAQEALSNVQRHARASEVSVELQYGSDMLVFAVEDDGTGFVMDEAATNGRYGLRGMRERAAALGGRLEIVSEPGHGAKVTLRTPIAPAER